MSSFFIPKRAMAIVAHPDDIEYTCAGTIARWIKAGCKVSYVLCTSGDVGIAEEGMTREKATLIREKEEREAAKTVGAEEVIFLRHPDGLLTATLDLRKELVREIRRFKPEVVICGDPTLVWIGENYINHPDHRAAGLAAIDAVFPAAGQPNLFEELEEEGLKAHKVRKVYAYGRTQTDLYVNIDETIDIKIQALQAHESQMHGKDPADHVREWATAVAKGKDMQYGEAFRVITLVDDETWSKINC